MDADGAREAGLAQARETLLAEAQAISRLADTLNEAFASAIQLILEARGRLVVMGIGKSGHVGRKLAATFASTGTPSLFVHPAEAVHGDLGMIVKGDLVLALSNSGETEELVRLLPWLEEQGIPVIAMTSRPESSLACRAKATLNLGVTREADPLGLAPTTSSTATLALGDALAAAVMRLRAFTARDFHRLHPGGSLGRKLDVELEKPEAGPEAARAAVGLESAPRVTVVGSFMVDLVFQTPRVPEEGETIIGESFGRFPGGKGANQAVGAARLGARVAMVGRVGDDLFAQDLVKSLEASGVDCAHVRRDPGASSGTAGIMLDARAHNRIVIIPGANMRVTQDDVVQAMDELAGSDVVMLQLEIPLPVVEYTAETAKRLGKLVILNPAPAQRLPEDFLRHVDVVTPNETEAEMLTGIRVKTVPDARKAAEKLLQMGARAAVITLGERGAYVTAAGFQGHVPAEQVEAVDTVAAGDAFNAGLAVELSRGSSLADAVRFANCAAAIAVTRHGAQPSMPYRDEVLALLAKSETAAVS